MLIYQASLPSAIVDLVHEHQGGIPARIEPPRSSGTDPRLFVTGRPPTCFTFPTDRRTGYIVASVGPLRLTDHHDLATSGLRIRPAQSGMKWTMTARGSHRILAGAGERGQPACENPGAASTLAVSHAAFLDRVAA